MNFKKLGLALAVAATATSANAAFETGSNDAGNTAGSSLLFAAYDSAAATALYVDLDVLVRQFDATQGLNYDLTSEAAATGVNLATSTWTVVGYDRVSGGGSCGLADLGACGTGYFATVSAPAPAPTYTRTQVSSVGGVVDDQWFLNISQNGIDANGGYVAIADGNPGSWITGAATADDLWGVFGQAGDDLGFAVAETTGVAGGRGFAESNEATVTQFAGSWSLSADGSALAYTPVPVPAAVWMFASGLVGLAGVARRRKQA